MTLVLANVFGMISGAIIMFFTGVILQTTLSDGLPTRELLLIPFVFGWAIALLITKPRRSTIAVVLDRGLLLGAIEWALAFPAALVVVLGLTSELEMVGSANLVGYALGALIIGGSVTLLGVGMFMGLRYLVRRTERRMQQPETLARISHGRY